MAIQQILRWATVAPNRDAIIWNGKVLSYREFACCISSARNFFKDRDLFAGNTALIVIPDLLRAWIVVHALRSLGINTLSVEALNIAETLDLQNVNAVVFTGNRPDILNRFDSASSKIKPVSIAAAELFDLATGNKFLKNIDNQKIGGHILCTSGTTGNRKQVLLEPRWENQRNQAWVDAFAFSSDSGFLALNYPLYTGVGFLKPMAVWSVGGSVTVDQRDNNFVSMFAPEVDHVVFVPSFLKRYLSRSGLSGSKPNPKLKLLVGGGFLTAETAQKALERISPDIELYYASTEIAAITLRSKFRNLEDLLWFHPTGSRRVEIVDDSGRECDAGREGEIRIELAEIDMHSYLDSPESSANVFRDGFFYPGDMAVKRADGRIRILGRTADVINIDGHKAAVAPIEEKLSAIFGAEEVCAFSTMDAKGKSYLLVGVRSEQPVTASQIKACSDYFPAFEHVLAQNFHDFPRFETGLKKIDRRKLKVLMAKRLSVE